MKQNKTESMSSVLRTIEDFAVDVESKFKGLLDSLSELRGDLQQISQLKDLVIAAESMLEGDVNHQVESEEAKGEVGRLFHAINETLRKLQQLDQGVHAESEKVPELAAHLDQITQETETATQHVLGKLDEMLEATEKQSSNIEQLRSVSDERLNLDREFAAKTNQFLVDLDQTLDRDMLVQEAIDFIALVASDAQRNLKNTENFNNALEELTNQGATLQDHSFDIMNLLQFQDITRQKISKVIGLLKELQKGLNNLLSIFNLDNKELEEIEISDHHQATQDNILARETNVDGREAIDVDAIIASFRKK